MKIFKTTVILLLNIFNLLFAQQLSVPYLEREFRAAWVATVANINWPSKPGLPEDQQKKEAIELLDLLKSTNYNAVIFQVRPQADAFYKSDLEPWSYYLTGRQGVAPEEFYDPLKFWIDEAHKRGIELHAWINPYRAHHKAGGEISTYSIVKQKPNIVVKLKDGYWWFDPGLEEAQDHCFTVIMDIARRYDVDGIHFDDYFYPYPSYNHNEDFPDSNSYAFYLENGGNLAKSDWRRDNVNQFIKRIYYSLKRMKPHVKFGVSPFGIWRPSNPQSIKGFDQYEKLYADAKLWLNKGWVDYFSPQLYWTINDIEQSFPVLLNWWNSENIFRRHLWPGLNIAKGTDETINQIMITRGMNKSSPGTIHWSIKPLVSDSTLSKELIRGPYKNQAAIPASTWMWYKKPKKIIGLAVKKNDKLVVSPIIKDIYKPKMWVVYYYYNNWNYKILPLSEKSIGIPLMKVINKNSTKLKKVAISILDRFGNESELTFIRY